MARAKAKAKAAGIDAVALEFLVALVIDTPDGIEFYRLCVFRARIRMEIAGLKGRGRTTYSLAKERYGLRGSRQRVLDQLNAKIEEAHQANRDRALIEAEPAGHA